MQEIRITELLSVTGNIQRNIDNLEEWMKPTEVATSMNPADRSQIVYAARDEVDNAGTGGA